MAILFDHNPSILLVVLLLRYALVVLSQQQIPIVTTAQATATNTPLQPKNTQDSCGFNGNTETICSPKSGDIWKNGTWYPITWNTRYPTYVSSPTLDIYIYFIKNYQNVLVKKISNVSTSKGTLPIFIDDTWRLDSSTQTYESLVYIIPNGASPEKELENRYSEYPAPIHNYVEQLALVPTSSLAAVSVTSITRSTQRTSDNLPPTASTTYKPSSLPTISKTHLNKELHNTTSIQPWIIAVIVLACLAVLGACLAIFWAMRYGRRRKLVYGEKGHLELNSTPSSTIFPTKQQLSTPTLPTNSTTTLVASNQTHSAPSLPTNKLYLQSGDPPQSTASFSNISSRSDPPLTSTEALLIADTFRQRMRKPDWKQQQQKKNTDDEEEEMKRRQLSQELLKYELEAEGALMKKVGKRARLLANTNTTTATTTMYQQPSLQ